MTTDEKNKLAELKTRYNNLLSRLTGAMEMCNQGVYNVVSSNNDIKLYYKYGQASKKADPCTVKVECATPGKLITEIQSSTPQSGKNTTYTIKYGDNGKSNLVLETGQTGKMDTTLTSYYDNGAVKGKFSCTGVSGSFTGCSTSVTGVSFGATIASLSVTGVSAGIDLVYATHATLDAEVVGNKLEESTSGAITAANEATVEAIANKVKPIVIKRRSMDNDWYEFNSNADLMKVNLPGPAVDIKNFKMDTE